jgi:twitching motility protein PilU
VITRDEGLVYADSPTNLMWRLQNDMAPVARIAAKREEEDQAVFTELTVDVRAEPATTSAASLRRF